jgi:hypothetical protein
MLFKSMLDLGVIAALFLGPGILILSIFKINELRFFLALKYSCAFWLPNLFLACLVGESAVGFGIVCGWRSLINIEKMGPVGEYLFAAHDPCCLVIGDLHPFRGLLLMVKKKQALLFSG